MKILVTGAKGFIGTHLVTVLENRKNQIIYPYDIDTDPALLDTYCRDVDIVFHLAGVNRPKNQTEYMIGNYGFTSTLLDTLKKYNNNAPVLLSSSIQASLDNPYGKSKKAGEDLLFNYGEETGAKVVVYRFPNVFGKWCRTNYNSAIATFCHNIAHDLPITINDPSVVMNLVYIDDVIEELIRALDGKETLNHGYGEVPVVHTINLGNVADLLYTFKESRGTLSVPDMSDTFAKKLYSTFLSYLPENQFNYPLTTHKDLRGSFTEFLKTPESGQVSVNISKPGIVKGNHWHHTKTEKFLVVSGKGIIRFRKVGSKEILEYRVNGDRLEVVDIPPGYTHNIENLGETDMVTIMWANENFDPEHPDTYYLEV
jgi:UDP-2-acetamido-2,6-beta-L-arabino-hexul-4-ose reductase